MNKFKFAISDYKNSDACIISFFQNDEERKNLEKLRNFGDIEPIDPKNFENILENLKICDVGNVKFKDFDEIYEKVLKIKQDKKVPIIFSCNHLTTLFSVGICEENSSILIFDAHADLKDFYESNYSRATWLRRLVELIDSERIFLIGIRSFDEDEKKFLEEEKINFLSSFKIKESIKNSIKKINDFLSSFDNVYVSFDVDVMENYLISSNYPEAFGLNMFEIYEIINNLEINDFVAMDFTEFIINKKEDAINLMNIVFQFLKKLKFTLSNKK
ncbi:MAG: arginase family protein [Candidatus Aenigmatarchaeota archaeon]